VNNFDQERQLLEFLALNDRTVIEGIYGDNYPVIQSFILNNNGNSDEARDIFQEAMIVMYEKAVSGSFELNCQLKTICTRFADGFG
jgi:DNA-directed RNA polymerase specialized sigma24 family protein